MRRRYGYPELTEVKAQDPRPQLGAPLRPAGRDSRVTGEHDDDDDDRDRRPAMMTTTRASMMTTTATMEISATRGAQGLREPHHAGAEADPRVPGAGQRPRSAVRDDNLAKIKQSYRYRRRTQQYALRLAENEDLTCANRCSY